MKSSEEISVANQSHSQYLFQDLDDLGLEKLKGGTRNAEAQITIKVMHGI